MNAKLLIVDGQPLVRHAMRDLMAGRPGVALVGEAATGAQAVDLARELAPDLVVMDPRLRDMAGLEAATQLLAAAPLVKIIIFSSDTARASVDQALQAGVSGYVSKCSEFEFLAQAIEMVMAGKTYLSPDVSVGILEDYRKHLVDGPEPAKPSPSERDTRLLRMVAEGLRNKEIASELAVSTKSVETYRSRLMKKLGCSSSAELVRYAIREGIAAA